MNTLFCRIALVAGCLSLSLSAMAYTSTDCTNVEQLASKGVVSYKNTCREYNLDRTITRQEVAAVTLKVGEICGSISNIPPQGQYMCDNVFSDVSTTYPNDWVCRVAETLARDGIISQNDQNTYGDVFFRPLKNVTRAEALAMLMSGANLEYQSTTYDDWRFSGTGAVAWQKPLMQYAYDRDVISSITTFGPNTNAFRRDVFNYAIKAINLCQTNGGNYNYNNNYSNNNCAIGQYASGNTCYSCNSLPWNGYYTTRGSCVWSCNSGYVKSGNTCVTSGYNYGTTGQCGASINSCVSGTFYDTTDYGNYAYWNCTGSNGNAVSCSAFNSGYNTNNCTVGQYWTGNMCLACTSKPSYAYYTNTGTCDWSCDSGYYRSGNTCVSNFNNTTCSTGQYRSGNVCYSCGTAPWNAYYTTTGSCDWTCNSGFYRSGNTCVSNFNNTTCSTGQYLSGNTCYSCGTAPWNAYYTTTGSCDWTCNSGFYRSGNTCVSNFNNTTCSTGQYLSGNTCYSCGTAPWNAYYTTTGSCDWTCNSGFYRSGNTCVSNQNNFGTTGQCGTSINSCISGTFYDTTDSGSYAYWTCMGTNGTSVSCSAYNNNNNYNNYNNCSIAMPTNAYYTNSQSCWSCNAGFVQINNMCVWWN
jgi:hypothetical protein